LTVDTPDRATIAKVTFIRTGSVTHAFDQSGRLVPLTFAPVSGGISVSLPASRTAAPPGPYMLFLVNTNGVPSVGRITRLERPLAGGGHDFVDDHTERRRRQRLRRHLRSP